MATKKESLSITKIEIPTPKLEQFTLKIVGDTPLICHRWAEKAKMEILGKQQKKATTAKEIRRPMYEFAESLYWLSEKPNLDGLTDEECQKVLAEVIPHSKFGFPVTAFKSAALDAGFQQGVLKRNAGTNDLAKTTARGAILIQGEFAVIEGTPTPRQDMVKIGQGTADLRFRGEFKEWRTELLITYLSNTLSIAQIVNLFMFAGFSNGIGEWRPAKEGSYGTFHVEL